MTRNLLVTILVVAIAVSMSTTYVSAQLSTTQNIQTKFIQHADPRHAIKVVYDRDGFFRYPASNAGNIDLDGYKKVCVFVDGSGAGNQFSILMTSPDGIGATVATGNFGSIICSDVEAPSMILSLSGPPSHNSVIWFWIYLIP